MLFDFVENLYLLQFATSEIFLVFKTRRFEFILGLSIKYVRKIFRKTNISNHVRVHTGG